MEVEARHLNRFSSQLINTNRNYLMNNNNVMNQGIIKNTGPPSSHIINPSVQFLGGNSNNIIPSAATTTFYDLPDDQQRQFSYDYQLRPINLMMFNNDRYSSVLRDKTSINTDNSSGLTYISRKRSRDHNTVVDNNNNEVMYNTTDFLKMNDNINIPQYSSSFVLVGEDLTPQSHQYQFDVDTLISQHTKKIRLELEERQKQKARLLVSTIFSAEGLMMKKLREKEEQIYKMGKINQALQEKVKNLYLENQLWRDLAQTNEATTNSLRTNLEQVLLSLYVDPRTTTNHVEEDDVESCCGSSNGGGGDEEERVSCYSDRLCKMCGERESSVLILPCRHLCLCGGCGGGSQTVKVCPVCDSSTNATLHVKMSS